MPKKGIGLDTMELAVVALIEHRSLKKAAAAVGVHPVTLWRWLKMPHFREQLREAQNQLYSQELARLQRLAPKAASVLEEMLSDQETPPSTRFRVAEYVLEQSKRPFAIDDIRLDDGENNEVLPTCTRCATQSPNITATPPDCHDCAASFDRSSPNSDAV